MRIYIQANQYLGVFCEVLLDLGFQSFTRNSALVLRSKVNKNLEKVDAALKIDRDRYNYFLCKKEFYETRDRDNEIYKITIKPKYRKSGYFRENYFCLTDCYYNIIYSTIRQTIEKDGLYLDTDKKITIEEQSKLQIRPEQALTLAFVVGKECNERCAINYRSWKTACHISDIILNDRYNVRLVYDDKSLEDLFSNFRKYFTLGREYVYQEYYMVDFSSLESELLSDIPEDVLNLMKIIFTFYLKDPDIDKHLKIYNIKQKVNDIDRICHLMKEKTDKLKELRKTDKEIAKVIANYNLQQAGILDEDGELTEPYRGIFK